MQAVFLMLNLRRAWEHADVPCASVVRVEKTMKRIKGSTEVLIGSQRRGMGRAIVTGILVAVGLRNRRHESMP